MAFYDKPQVLWWRKALFQVHLWCGISIGLILSVVGLTGSILVFYQEMREWQVPRVTLQADVPHAPIADLVRKTSAQFPGLHFPYIGLPEHSGDPVVMEAEEGSEGHRAIIYLHPQTGEVVGDTVHKEWFLDWVYRFHESLLAGDGGFTFNAICAMLGCLMCVSGAILWWPGVKSWVRALKVNMQAGWKRVNYDLHSALGFYSVVALGFVFFTGIYFRFPEPFVKSMEALSGTKGWIDSPVVKASGPRSVTPEQAIALAEAHIPDAVTTDIQIPAAETGVYYVGRKKESDGLPWAGNGVYVNPYNGAIETDYIRARDTTPVSLLQEWVGFIHFGTFGGLVTKLLWVPLGLIPLALFVTGTLMYWNRSLGKKWRRRGSA